MFGIHIGRLCAVAVPHELDDSLAGVDLVPQPLAEFAMTGRKVVLRDGVEPEGAHSGGDGLAGGAQFFTDGGKEETQPVHVVSASKVHGCSQLVRRVLTITNSDIGKQQRSPYVILPPPLFLLRDFFARQPAIRMTMKSLLCSPQGFSPAIIHSHLISPSNSGFQALYTVPSPRPVRRSPIKAVGRTNVA